ncbi:MAG TPA: diguanylate cyclase [Armatimonadota bacterium]
MADDSLVMRRLLGSSLESWGYDVICAGDGGEAWAVLSQPDAPQIAVLDWMMPVHSGPELCRMVRGLRHNNYTYLILLTSRGLTQDTVEGLSAGADDYIVKPFERQELEVRLRVGRRIIDLHTELIATRKVLLEQATRDALTKTWNRAAILETLDREASRCLREGIGLGVLMIDLDHFKRVNDTFGHQVGDEALREAARRIQGARRAGDSFGRYGGEEFIMVVPGCDDFRLFTLAERLRLLLGSEPFLISGHQLRLTASFGACCAAPGSAESAKDLVRSADSALYEAKRGGRNRTVLAESLTVPHYETAQPQSIEGI